MRYPPSLLDEIRARLPVSSVVERRVRLKKQGREFVGLSPFKQEKTPSFTVNDQKGFYHCFATGEHGDVFKFLMKVDGLSFPEAVEQLAGEAGVDLPKPTPQAEAREAQAVALRKITEESCRFFQDALTGRQGREARAYLERRGLGEDVIAHFRLGYAQPGRHQLKDHLAAKGFRPEDINASGMLIWGGDIPVSYDRFRNRLMFPITDLRGGVIAFGGRALADEQQPKYLNSPETPLFHKGSVLFNAAAARKAAHERGELIVAEGYMDVIAFHRAGLTHAVAPLGTSLTPDQIRAMWRMADEPVLCFDGDAAGLKAAYRAVETAMPLLMPNKSLSFVLLPDGLDPDDFLRKRGSDALAEALKYQQPMIDVLWRKELSAGTWTTPERLAGLGERFKSLTQTIRDPGIKKNYDDAIRDRIWAYRKQNRLFDAKPAPAPLRQTLAKKDPARHRDAELLKIIVDNEDAIEDFYEEICSTNFAFEEFNILKQHILDSYLGGKSPIRDNLANNLAAAEILAAVDSLAKPLRSLGRNENPDEVVNNLKQYFRAQAARESDEQIRLAMLNAADRGDETDWLETLPALAHQQGFETSAAVPQTKGAADKTALDEMVRLAMVRLSKTNKRGDAFG